MSRTIDLSLLIEDNMPAHKLFQRPIYLEHLTHESSKAQNLGVPGDPMTFQTNFIGMLDHVGTHVEGDARGTADRHSPQRRRNRAEDRGLARRRDHDADLTAHARRRVSSE